jgi:hypothetical protein
VDLKYFLMKGLFQGRPEEYNSWENDPQGKPRRAVDGVTGLLEYHDDWSTSGARIITLSHRFLALKYQTGYQSLFKYSTVRLEAGAQLGELPLAVWVQTGYMSDLANYYRNVTSFGIEARIVRF